MANERPAPFAPQPGHRVAVIAGSGGLPRQVVDALTARGHRPLVLAIDGEGEWPDDGAFDLVRMPLSDPLGVIPAMRAHRVTHAVLAGGVARRHPILRMRPRLAMLGVLPRLAAAYARGDDNLLRVIIGYIESLGIGVVGPHQIVPDLLAAEGALTRRAPGARDRVDIRAGLEAARAIGALDIGQAAVAIGGRAVALEGIEGTDGLLARMAGLRGHGRLAGRTGGVLVKCAKPGQELRVDLPAIGPATVEAAHAAGLAGIAVEADRSLVLDAAVAVARADALGVFIAGVREATP